MITLAARMDPAHLDHLIRVYGDGLLDDTIPFWMKHGADDEAGGIQTCLDRDGSLLDTDKGVWQQGRFVWMLGALYNTVEPRPEWLAAMEHTLRFIEAHCFDADGRMFFHVTREGRPVRKRRYAFSEAFAAIAFGEHARATGSAHSREMAERLYRAIDEIRRDFMKPDLRCCMENVGPDGEIIDHLDGRILTPGHAIEGAWFMMREGKSRNVPEYVRAGCDILDWMWDRGWDQVYGGLLCFVDVQGKPVVEYWHDMKFWWPQNEAIIATLLAYQLTGDAKYARMHAMIHDYAYGLFPDPEFGDWFGYLHRDGRLSSPIKGNLYKGCFHVPRHQLACWRIAEEIRQDRVGEFTVTR